MAGINHIRRWVMSQMTKKADDGIMITLPDSKKVDLNVSITMDRLLRNGIDPDAFTNPEQVNNAINMINSRMVSRAIPADSAEGREITEKLFGKQKAPVFDLEGNRIPEGSGIMGGKSVKDLMESGQVTKGARGMKKSKKVQDREMFKAANQRLTSDVDSIIKNIKSMEPVTAMKEANSVIARKGKYKNLTPEQSKKILQDTEDHIFERDIPEDPEGFAKGGRIGLKGGADAATESFSKSAGSTRPGRKDPVGGFNLSGGQGPTFGGAPPTTGGGGGGNNNNPPPFSTNNTTPDTTFFNKTSKSGLMSNISPTILARLARIKKGLTPIIGEDIGLQYQNIDELNDILTNFRITQDLEDLIKTKKLEPELKYRKEIGDNTLIEGGINQAGDASIMFKKQFADGGRANFVGGGMGRRGFLKMLAGLGGGIAAAKTGLLKLAGKEPAKQVAKEVVKQSSGTYPPPYFFKLAEKIKFMGDDVTKKAATKDREIVTKYKDYEMSEDVATGEIVIKKRTEGSFYDQDGIISDEYIIYKPGMADETTKGKPPPEYEEFTVRPDGEGKLRDSEDGLDSINEILEEVGDPDSLTIKKAGGGIARLGYQMGGDVAYDATNQDIYGSSAITVTPDTMMDQFGNQVQAEMGNNFNKPLISQVTEQASKQEGIMNSSPVVSQLGGTGEVDMPIAGGNNNAGGILPVEPVNQLPGFRDDTPTKMPGGPPPEEIKYNDPLPQDQLMSGFAEWKQKNPDKVSYIGTQAIKYMILPNGQPITFPGGAEASNMARYLESIGQPPMTPGNQNFKPIGDPNAKLEMALASGGIARMLGE